MISLEGSWCSDDPRGKRADDTGTRAGFSPLPLVCTPVVDVAVWWSGVLFWTLMAEYEWLKQSLIATGIRGKERNRRRGTLPRMVIGPYLSFFSPPHLNPNPGGEFHSAGTSRRNSWKHLPSRAGLNASSATVGREGRKIRQRCSDFPGRCS